MVASSQSSPPASDRGNSTAARHILICLLVIATVALLTVLFSFLGTISCAALLGMMFSSIRQGKWKVIGISLVFPVVSFTLSRSLGPEKNLLLASLCFGVFWCCYLLTCGMLVS